MYCSRKGQGLFVVVLSLLFLILLISSVSAVSDVAYIYDKAFRIDSNIVNAFNEMNLSVALINVNNKTANLSKYRIVFVGDEVFNGDNIPVYNYNSIVANYYHGAEWGLTDADGISQMASNSPLSILINGSLIQAYTQAIDSKGIAIQYYYLADGDKSPNLIQLAGTNPGARGVNKGDVVSVAETGTQLFNGITTKGRLCFYGIVRSAYWTPISKQLLEECIGYVLTKPAINCTTDSDCGTNGFIGNQYCSSNNLFNDFKTFTCNNPGTIDSSCSNSTAPLLNQTCSDYCSNGQCQTFTCHNNSECNDHNSSTEDICNNPDTINSTCSNNPITCFFNSDCGANSPIGDLFCSSNSSLSQNFISFTCNNAGHSSSYCSNSTSAILNKTCSINQLCEDATCKNVVCFSNTDCNDNNSYTEDVCNNPGTPSSNCTYNPITCVHNSDCGTDSPIGGLFCSGKNVSQSFISFTCNLNGTSLSYCSNSTSQILNQTCSIGCLGGSCINAVHDVALVAPINSVDNIKIRINASENTSILGDVLECNKSYQIVIDVSNLGNSNETVSFFGSVGGLPLSYSSTALTPGQTKEKYYTINLTLPDGLYDISVNASIPLDINLSNNEAIRQINVSCVAPSQIINCTQNSDCNDYNSSTEDICNNPGTLNSTCTHNPITCFFNSDCGANGFIGNQYCSSNNLFNDFKTFTCNNPGTIDSSCSNSTAPLLNQTCSDYCSNGQCQTFTCHNNSECNDHNSSTQDICNNPNTIDSSCSNIPIPPIKCNVNSDCGTNGQIGGLFCSGKNVSQSFISFTCNNPGLSSSSCSNSTSSILNKTCSDYCSNGQCQIFTCHNNSECNDHNSSTEDICTNPGTISSSCVHHSIKCYVNADCNDHNNRTIDVCNNPGTALSYCSNTEVSCIRDSDCGIDGITGIPYCFGNIILQNYVLHQCLNPGMFNASCLATAQPQTNQTCPYACSNGQCVRCNVNMDCNDNNISTEDICTNHNCVYNKINCSSNTDCNDNNASTQDICNHPGTLNSTCTHNPITCFFNSDCGANGFIGSQYCSSNNLFNDFRTFVCNNPGTSSSSCSLSIEPELVKTCDVKCLNDECVLNNTLFIVLDRKVSQGLHDYYCPDGYYITGVRFHDKGNDGGDNYVYGIYCSNVNPDANQSEKEKILLDNKAPKGEYSYNCSDNQYIAGVRFHDKGNDGGDNYIESMYCAGIEGINQSGAKELIQVDRDVKGGFYDYFCSPGSLVSGVEYHEAGSGDDYASGLTCVSVI